MAEINQYVFDLVETNNPEIVIINIPYNLLMYSSVYMGDYGACAYKLTRAVPPDILVMEIPYNEYRQEDLDYLNTMLTGICGQEIDFYVVESSIIDIDATEKLRRVQMTKVEGIAIGKTMDKLENVYISDSSDRIKMLVDAMIGKLSSFAEIEMM